MGTARGRILVVDDEIAVGEVVVDYLTEKGYEAELVPDGAQAIASVHRQKPDLVLLDMTLPGMPGVDVLRTLQGFERELPVVMITGNADADLAQTTLRLGAFDYIAKPIDFPYLDRVVEAALTRGGHHHFPD